MEKELELYLYCTVRALTMPTLCPFLTVPRRVGLQSVIVAFIGNTLSFFETIIIVDNNTIGRKRNLKYTYIVL